MNAEVARVVRQQLLNADIEIPDDIAQTTDHIAILRFAGKVGGEPQARVEALSIAAEVGAASPLRASSRRSRPPQRPDGRELYGSSRQQQPARCP